MNWHMIISVLIIVVLKAVGVTLFLLYFSQIFGNSTDSIIPTRSYGTVCPPHWQNFHQIRCFFLSTSESTLDKSRDDCARRGSTLAIVDTPEKLRYLQDKANAEKYFIGLMYKPAEKKWHWINNSAFNGNVTNENQNFNCVTIGLSTTFDAASCDVPYRWICELILK
ncbi:PREDICTED: C-type lectin domain family 5 member A isoform X5 [Chinchilla lanigera]|uniref:C-type lectin domain family 5 member A isoform X5 n=1 Tax=Chinchilla lanigera TaxID=34839 RepID=UPI00038EE231|nr:PREDICTED: C-type lectin domain family 5 member A isoform X5 [Chinchilla lanigera]